jgi:ubiquinone/menaquinone biosynthesis C-methylase UbiE
MRKIYSNDFIGQVDMYDELPLWSAPFGLKLLEKVIPARNLKVLDIGYGTGFPLTEIAMRLGESCKVYGIDPDPLAEEITSRKLKSFSIRNVELIKGVAEDIPMDDEFVDLVVSNNGLNNTKDFNMAISECSRVLRPGGKLLFTMNLDGTMKEFYEIMEEVLMERALNRSIRSMYDHIRKKRKPLIEVLATLGHHGFCNVSSENNQFHYYFTDAATMSRHNFIRLAFLPDWEKIIPKKSRVMIFNEIRLRINKSAEKAGYFRLTVPYTIIEAIKN